MNRFKLDVALSYTNAYKKVFLLFSVPNFHLKNQIHYRMLVTLIQYIKCYTKYFF